MPIEQLREYVSLGFTVAFWIWFAAFALTAANLAWSAVQHYGGEAARHPRV
jgi:hypothetical protein